MRILITGESFPPNAGGSGWSTHALAKGLKARGHFVQVVQPRPGLTGTRMRTFDDISVIEFGYRAQNIPGARSFLRRLDLERGLALGRLGPVTEGLFVWIAGLGALIVVAIWIGVKAK